MSAHRFVSALSIIAFWREAPDVSANRELKNQRGASLVEYALLVALIAIVCVVAVRSLGGTVDDTFDDLTEDIILEDGTPAAAIP